MTDPDLIGLFIAPLERIGVKYMVTGGVASVIYGDPRFTRDIDLVVDLAADELEPLTHAFEGGDFYVPPLEALREEASRPAGGHFNLIHRDTSLRADIYVTSDDPLHAWGFARRKRVQVEKTSIWVAPIEYVIVRKLEYFAASGSDRHLRDVAMMLRISRGAIDNEELEHRVIELGLMDQFQAALAFDP